MFNVKFPAERMYCFQKKSGPFCLVTQQHLRAQPSKEQALLSKRGREGPGEKSLAGCQTATLLSHSSQDEPWSLKQSYSPFLKAIVPAAAVFHQIR